MTRGFSSAKKSAAEEVTATTGAGMVVGSVIGVGVADSGESQKEFSGHNQKNYPSIKKNQSKNDDHEQGYQKISIPYAEEHFRQLTRKARHDIDIMFPPEFGVPQVDILNGKHFVARFPSHVQMCLKVGDQMCRAVAVGEGKTTVQALRRLFAEYACSEHYERLEVRRSGCALPDVFIAAEHIYETVFVKTDPQLTGPSPTL